MGRLHPRELLFPLLLGLAIAAVGSLPYWHGYATQGEDEVFMGFVGRGTPGANGYFSFARQAAEGHLLFVNQMTPEPGPRAYFSLQWLAFGLFSKWTGLSLAATFHVGRVLTVLLFVLAAYYLAGQCLDRPFQRRLAVSLTVLGAGFGWVVWLVNKAAGADLPFPLDIRGVSVFGYLVNNPHFIRAGLFAALQYAFLLRGEQTGKLRYFLLSGLANEGHSLIRPYHVPETILVYGLFPVFLCLVERRFDARRFLNYGAAGLVALPGMVYIVVTTLQNVLGMAGWYRQSLFLIEQVLWMGLPFLAVCIYAALFGMTRARQARRSDLLLAYWIACAWLLTHAFPYFNAGHENELYPLALAAPILLLRGPLPLLHAGLGERAPRVAEAFSRKRVQRLAAVALVLACMPSSAYVYARFFNDLHAPVPPYRYYLDYGTHRALEWLADNARESEVVLASQETSQFVPRMTACKVVTGHDMLTAHYGEKNGLVWRFLHIPGEDGFKQWIARRFNVRYVVCGPEERSPGGMNPQDHPWLREIFRADRTTVYRVSLDRPRAE